MRSELLNRMELDDAGSNPQAIAQAIHQQLGMKPGPVPVHEIAQALDIVEIRAETLSSLEGALITTPERSHGSILVNQCSGYRRQRFTVSHELGHFLNSWHRPTSDHGFSCSRADMRIQKVGDDDRHKRQEAEANAFAIELLAPEEFIATYLGGPPDLQNALSMADDLKISKAAAARRYVSNHEDRLALVFSCKGLFQYVDRHPEFPWIQLVASQPVPSLPVAPNGTAVSDMDECDAQDWLGNLQNSQLQVQTLYQQEGYAITLLHLNGDPEDEEAGSSEDSFDRFMRFSNGDRD